DGPAARGGAAPGVACPGDVPLVLRRRLLVGVGAASASASLRHPPTGPPMSPLPRRERLGEYAVKGAHLALRQIGAAPEQRHSRRLAAQAPRSATGGKRVALLSPRDWAA